MADGNAQFDGLAWGVVLALMLVLCLAVPFVAPVGLVAYVLGLLN